MGHFSAAIVKLIFLFNLILLLIGILLIYCGIFEEALPKELNHFGAFFNQLSFASKVMLAIGVLIFIVSFFGCWGTFVESTSFLSLYAIFLIVLIMVEAFVGFYLHFKKDSLNENIEDMFKDGMQKYHSDKTYEQMFDFMQHEWKCCGEKGPKDWAKINKSPVPQSCCKDGTTTCNVDNSFQQGCLKELLDMFDVYRGKLFWIVLGAAAFKVAVVLLTLLVRNSISESRRMII